MDCPRHQAELQRKLIEEHPVDQCPDCEGRWIPGSLIDQLLGSGEKMKLRSLCSVRISELLCPADKHTLYEGKIGQVTVDLCQHCNGLWLDPGELETLRTRKPLKPHVSTAPTAGIDHSVSATDELLLYGVLGVLF